MVVTSCSTKVYSYISTLSRYYVFIEHGIEKYKTRGFYIMKLPIYSQEKNKKIS